MGTIPPERFPTDQLWSEDGSQNRINSTAGGFIDGIEDFDAAFFRTSRYEAVRIDPQHRLLLEATREALDDAGIPAESLAGSATSVFSGCLSADYWDVLRRAGAYDLHAAMGSGTWGIPAGRIAHDLDLRGPTMGVEAACATSGLAVHLACLSLASGESDLALVAVANLLMSPDFYYGLSDAQILSPRGRCRFGDAGADGYVRSEGVVTLVLKREADAVRDGDRIYASVLGSAVNNNGSAAGPMISPGIEGQADVLRAAYARAGVRPADVDLVEAHGAGTPGGDYVELTALRKVLGPERPAGRPCLVGSVKSNIGHTEVTAGAAGLLKVALALHHGVIPATLHVEQPNPVVDMPDCPLELVRESRPWPIPEGDRSVLAGVSSFGLSGSNAHLVLAPAPTTPRPVPRRLPETYLLPLSARDPQALRALALRAADRLAQVGAPAEVRDVCHSFGARRSHHDHRAAVVGRHPAELMAELRRFGLGEQPDTVVGGDRVPDHEHPLRVVHVFSGHGSQWVGMGRGLLRCNATFAAVLRRCSAAVRREVGWSVVERLRSDEPLATVAEAQPVIWAVQVALAAAWRDWGLVPDTVIGHSMGEVAAAVTAGALTLEDGARVICRRSGLVRDHAAPGAMWAVQLGEEEARAALAGHGDLVEVGVVNSGYATVLSGDEGALDEVVAGLRERGVFARRVQVDYASHAPQVAAVRDPLMAALADLRPQAAAVPMISTVTARAVAGAELDAGYWWRNLRLPVCFADAVRAVLTDGDPRPVLFVEVSSHPQLLSATEDVIDAEGAAARAWAMPSLVRDRPEEVAMLTGVARAYTLGARPTWTRLTPGGSYTPLPAYPWQRRRAWIADDRVGEGEREPAGALLEPLLEAMPVALGRRERPHLADASFAPVTAPAPAAAAPGARHSLTSLTEHLVRRVADVLGLAPDELDPGLSPTQFGLDSLLAARVREYVHKDFGVAVAVRELLSAGTVVELAGLLHERSRLAG